MKKFRWILIAVLAVLCVGFLAYAQYSDNSGYDYEGIVTHFDCTTAGVGCQEYTLNETSQGRVGLSGSSVAELQPYIGKNVRIKGSLHTDSYPPGGKYIQVESIRLK
jgi:hypothetical protein